MFIASAQLKGPFGNGWQNPWSRRGGNHYSKVAAQLEVPETTVKSRPRRSSQLHGVQLSSGRSAPLSPVRQPIKQNLASGSPKVLNAVSTNLQTSATYTAASSSKTKQVEEWLKKNDSYSKEEQPQPPASPTPINRPANARTKKWESPVIDVEFPPVVDDIVNIAALPSLRLRDLPNTRAIVPITESGQLRAESHEARLMTSVSVQPAFQTTTQHTRGTALEVTSQSKSASEGSLRIEITTLAAKRRSLHTIPPSSHLSAFEYRPVAGRAETQDVEPAEGAQGAGQPPPEKATEENGVVDADNRVNSNDHSSSLHTAEERLPSSLAEITTVLPDDPHSNHSTPHDIPSAQIPIQISVESAPSNLSGTGVLLEEPVQGIAQATNHSAPLKQNLKDVAEPPQEGPLSNQSRDQEQCVDVNIPINSIQSPALLHSAITPNPKAITPSDTQEMIESITPFEFSTIEKNKRIEGPVTSAPQTTTKTRTMRARKRASFAPDEVSSGSSGGSLKAVMKVAKSATINVGSVNGLKDIWDHEGEDLNSIHHISNSPQRAASTGAIMKNAGPRGILKPSSNPSAPAPTSGTHNTSSSVKQDAQRVRALGMIEGETEKPTDSFDVDAAIDDLGSFLGMWDAEKEALGL